MDKKEFTVDEIACAYCVYYNPVLEDYMRELDYNSEDGTINEGIASFSFGEDALAELKLLLPEEKMLKLFAESTDGDYKICTVEDGKYSFDFIPIK